MMLRPALQSSVSVTISNTATGWTLVLRVSFAPDEIVFPAYDANQLGDILNRRRDAYHDGVLSQTTSSRYVRRFLHRNMAMHGVRSTSFDSPARSLATTMPTTSAKNTSALPTMMPK